MITYVLASGNVGYEMVSGTTVICFLNTAQCRAVLPCGTQPVRTAAASPTRTVLSSPEFSQAMVRRRIRIVGFSVFAWAALMIRE
jgi:hypothetical protein